MKNLGALVLTVVLTVIITACGGVDAVDPDAVSIDTLDLPYSWQANLIEATEYDDSQPPGAMGLPEHLQINFGVTDPADVQFGDPIIYIIPTEEYKEIWDGAGNSAVSERLVILEDLLADQPDLDTVNLPVLPFEAYKVMGAGNLALTAQPEYVKTAWGRGVRFIAAPMQGIDAILNRNVVYIEQGLTDDRAYLVSFNYPPVSTSELSNEITEEELQQVNSDWATYLQEKEVLLNSLSGDDWDPQLNTLDEVTGSLQFGEYGQ